MPKPTTSGSRDIIKATNLSINQYVGEIANGVDFDLFTKAVKEDARGLKLAVDSLQMKVKDGLLTASCNGDVANVIRGRKEVLRFRCDKVAGNDKD